MNADGFALIDRLEKSKGGKRIKLTERIGRAAAYARAEQRAEYIAFKIAEERNKSTTGKRN